MSDWDFNLTGMPLGSMVPKTVTTKDVVRKYDEWEPDAVILATKCGKVIKTYWLPKEKRWAGLASGEHPIAYMRWPLHPGANGNGK